MTTAEEMTAEIHRDLGRLEGTVAAQGAQIVALHAKTDTQTELLQEIKAHIERERGARKMLAVLAGAAGSMLTGAAALALELFKTHKP